MGNICLGPLGQVVSHPREKAAHQYRAHDDPDHGGETTEPLPRHDVTVLVHDDVPVEIREEVVIVVRPVPTSLPRIETDHEGQTGPDPLEALRRAAGEVVASAAGLVTFTAQSTIKLAYDTASSAVNTTLDAVVPRITSAIVSRVDITQIVVDHVDVNKIAAQVELEPIIDRVPITDIADYVVKEIDLPEVIRGSTGGLADQVLQALRFKAIAGDDEVERLVDRLLRWRKGQKLEVGE